MKQMKRYWFLGVLAVVALLFAGMTFAATKRPHLGKADLKAHIEKSNTGKLPKLDAIPNVTWPAGKGMDNFKRPAFKDFSAVQAAMSGKPSPESLCDLGYYWMGGPTWTCDTDGKAVVWAAGGNLYFSDAVQYEKSGGKPESTVEMWWGDIGLRVRIHNSLAYVFSFYYTYVFDVSDPLNPSFVNYGPGFVYGFLDALPSPDDNYLIMSDWGYVGGLMVWDLNAFDYLWGPIWPIDPVGWYWDMYIVEDQNVLICGDWWMGSFDMWDLGDLACGPPTPLGQIFDPYYNTGIVFYRTDPSGDGYIYGNYETWQWYHPYVFPMLFAVPPGFDPSDYGTWISVIHCDDLRTPWNYQHTQQWDPILEDTVSIKDTNDGIVLSHYQNLASYWDDQFFDHRDSVYLGTLNNYKTLDGAYIANVAEDTGTGIGVGACMAGGARFWDGNWTELWHFWTGGFACGINPVGNYAYVPSGGAGIGFVDISDPSWMLTAGAFEPTTDIISIFYAAPNADGTRTYVADMDSQTIWTIDTTDKANPALVSSIPYDTGFNWITKLFMINGMLGVCTDDDFFLLDVTTNPLLPTLLASTGSLGERVWSAKPLWHPSYPDQDLIGLVTPTTFYTYWYDGAALIDTGNIPGGFTNLRDLAIVGQMAYLVDIWSNIYPVKLISQSPNIYFVLDQAGTVPYVGNYDWETWTGFDPPYFPLGVDATHIVSPEHGMLVTYMDDLSTGDFWPALDQVDIGTNPLVPVRIPATWIGVMPFDMLTGLDYSVATGENYGDFVWYATDWFGIGAMVLKPDLVAPFIVSQPTVTPATYDNGTVGHMPNPWYWIQETVRVSATVQDNETAITKVQFQFWDDYTCAWRTIKTFTTSTAAGTPGTYSFDWDTTTWMYTGTGPSPIRVKVTDSGCNTTVWDTWDTGTSTYITYCINTLPTYEIDSWDICNAPPTTGLCAETADWVVCGTMTFQICGITRPEAFALGSCSYNYSGVNEVPTNVAPIDDVSQIAYKIDDGAWVLFPVPWLAVDGSAQYWCQAIALDTTLLTDGQHTMYVRIADDCGLHGFEDINGQSSWTFSVHNLGPKPYIVEPSAGDWSKGEIYVAVATYNELASRPVNYVEFWVDPTDYNDPTTGTLIGTTTTKDSNGYYSIMWDATAWPLGDHVMIALVWENAICCAGPFKTPLVSFKLVTYTGMTVSASAAPQTGAAPLATTLSASVSGGVAPYTYAWAFGDSQTGVGNVVGHTYTAEGNYTATVTVTDSTATTATASVAIVATQTVCDPPVITSARKAQDRFKVHIYGSKFAPGCQIKVNGTIVPTTKYFDATHIVAKRGGTLKSMFPNDVVVQITVTNPDGCVSNSFGFAR